MMSVPEEDPDIVTAKPSEKSNLTLDALDKLTQEDESLHRYKQALMGNIAVVDETKDPRKFVLVKLVIEMQDHPMGDAVYAFDMSLDNDVQRFHSVPIIFKEGCIYRFKLVFRVQHNISSNLQMNNKTTKAGIKLYTQKMFCGSFSPTVENHIWESELFEAPSGFFARTSFTGCVTIFDDDTTHAELKYNAEVKSGWS